MSVTQQLAKHFRDVHFGGNWTCVNLKDTLNGVTWQQATTQVHDCNTIAMLVFHINYYIAVQIKVLQGGPLDAHDKYSFDCPPVQSQQDWDNMLDNIWANAETLATLVEQLPESRLRENFVEEKYGTYYRNLQGLIEHTHYHLGQISLLKKITGNPTGEQVPQSYTIQGLPEGSHSWKDEEGKIHSFDAETGKSVILKAKRF